MSDISKVRGKYADGIKPSEKAHIGKHTQPEPQDLTFDLRFPDTAESWRQDLFRQYCTKPNSKVVPSHKYEFYKYIIHLHAVRGTPG